MNEDSRPLPKDLDEFWERLQEEKGFEDLKKSVQLYCTLHAGSREVTFTSAMKWARTMRRSLWKRWQAQAASSSESEETSSVDDAEGMSYTY